MAEDQEDAQSAGSGAALASVLESCCDKAAALNKVLQAVMPPAGASRMERYLRALKTIPNADKVEDLMEGMLRDLQVLTANRAVKAATRVQVERLIAAMRTGGKLGDGGGRPAIALHNHSRGSQYVHTGPGHQNTAAGGAIQINGASTGPFYFGRTE